jgi:hypothetical protein
VTRYPESEEGEEGARIVVSVPMYPTEEGRVRGADRTGEIGDES